jgi:hypothetical protein
MKTTISATMIFVTLCCAILLTQGCGDNHDHGTAPAGTAAQDAHAALHKTKYNEVLVEFPGHKYAMEIIDEMETTGLVKAFLTDAHFNPVAVDTKEVQLNFMVEGQPKAYTLTRIEQASGEPATFTFTDKDLATLICEGWQGEATASVEIGGTPYKAKMVKLAGHDAHAH